MYWNWCILQPWSVWGSIWPFSVSSGAVVNFSQWWSCFWQFCVCHFGCLKNDIFWASLQLRTSWTLSMGSVLNIFSKGAWGNPGIKEGQPFFLENALNLDKVHHKNDDMPFWYFWPGFLPFFHWYRCTAMNILKSFEIHNLKLHFYKNTKICKFLPIFWDYFFQKWLLNLSYLL